MKKKLDINKPYGYVSKDGKEMILAILYTPGINEPEVGKFIKKSPTFKRIFGGRSFNFFCLYDFECVVCLDKFGSLSVIGLDRFQSMYEIPEFFNYRKQMKKTLNKLYGSTIFNKITDDHNINPTTNTLSFDFTRYFDDFLANWSHERLDKVLNKASKDMKREQEILKSSRKTFLFDADSLSAIHQNAHCITMKIENDSQDYERMKELTNQVHGTLSNRYITPSTKPKYFTRKDACSSGVLGRALQFDGTNYEEILDFVGPDNEILIKSFGCERKVMLSTWYGAHPLHKGDYVIGNVGSTFAKSFHMPCSDDSPTHDVMSKNEFEKKFYLLK